MATPTFRWPRLAAMPRAGANARPAPAGAWRPVLNGPRNIESPDIGKKGRCRRPRQPLAWQRHLVIMVKAPQAGRVKTRLASEIGTVAATSFYRHASHALMTRLARDPRWVTWLAVAPDAATGAKYWPRGVRRMPQGPGDLGRRMQRVFDQMPPGPAVIIGSDCPGIGRADIAAAFQALGSAKAVFGPAADGGYSLVGQRRTPRPHPIFANVRWSSSTTLADTLANLAGQKVAMLGMLSDVDEASDLQRLAGTSGRRVRG